MCESLGTTSEMTEDKEKMNKLYQQNELLDHVGSLCTEKSGFTTLVN